MTAQERDEAIAHIDKIKKSHAETERDEIVSMREAIKEAAQAMENLIIAKRGGMQPANALIDATSHAKETLAKLQPFLI